MSRSRKGTKPIGFDYWGRRGMKDKKTTHRKERRGDYRRIQEQQFEDSREVIEQEYVPPDANMTPVAHANTDRDKP